MAFPTGWINRKIVINGSQIAATLTGFIVELTEVNLPVDMLTKGNSNACRYNGGDIRFSSDSSGSTRIPHDVVYIKQHATPSSAKALIKVKVDLVASTDKTIWIWYNGPESFEARNSTYGAEAVYSANHALSMMMTHDLTSIDRTSNKNDSVAVDTAMPNSDLTLIRDTTAYASFPSLIKLQNGDLLCSFREGSQHEHNVSGNIYFYKSTDKGETWASLSSITDASYDLRDATLTQLADGTVFVHYARITGDSTQYREFYALSSDNGATWGAPVMLSTREFASHGKAFEMANGNIAVPVFEADALSSIFDPWICIIETVGWTVSEYQIDATNSYNEWSVIEKSDAPGTLIGFFRHNTNSTISRATSTDGGVTWGSISVVITTGGIQTPPHPAYVSNGDLLLAASYNRAGGSSWIYRSTDHGATFVGGDTANNKAIITSSPVLTGNGFYESFAELDNGEFYLVFYSDSSGLSTPAKVYGTKFYQRETGELIVYSSRGDTSGVLFNGSSHRMELPNKNYDFVHQSGVFTIYARIKLTNYLLTDPEEFCSSTASSSESGFTFRYTGSANKQILFYIAKGVLGVPVISALSDTNAITDNNEHLIEVKCDGSTLTFKVDGIAKGTVNITESWGLVAATRTLKIARYRTTITGGYLNGKEKSLDIINETKSSGWSVTVANNLLSPGSFASSKIDLTGSLNCESSFFSGNAVKKLSALSGMTTSSSNLAGSAIKTLSSSGSSAVSSSLLSGQSIRVLSVFGGLIAHDCQLTGISSGAVMANGAMSTQNSIISGTAMRVVDAIADFISAQASLSGTAAKGAIRVANGSMVSASAVISGGSVKSLQSSGVLISDLSTISALAVKSIDAAGDVSTGSSIMAGEALVIGTVTANGVMVTDIAYIEGVAVNGTVTSTPDSRIIMIPAHDRNIVIPLELLDFYK